VAQEINEALAESGQIILTELAPRFSLTTDFVVQVNNATHDTTRHDTTRHAHDTTRHGTARHGTARHDTQHSTTRPR